MENKIAEYIAMTYEEIISIAEEASGYNDLYLVDTYGVWINSKNTKRSDPCSRFLLFLNVVEYLMHQILR